MGVHPLKQERLSRGWSQVRLAKMLGVSPRSVSRWEQGKMVPYPIYREKLCALFGKDADALGLLPRQEQAENVVEQERLPVPSDVRSVVYDPWMPGIHGMQGGQGKAYDVQGRDELLATLRQQLQAHKRTIALSGLPGVGKTALVTALVMDKQIQASFHNGILWAGVGPSPDVVRLLGHWVSLLGAATPTGEGALRVEEWGQILRTVIGNRRMLLVLDDVWQAETAMMLQVGGPNCAYILTTHLPQVAFAFAEQAVVHVPELSEDQGMALLAQTMPMLVAQEAESVRGLVRAVGGLPLALKLLGQVLSSQIFTRQPRRVQATLTRLQEAEERLQVSMPVTPADASPGVVRETQLSLQATIALSEQQLSTAAQNALRTLAIFPAKPNSFSEEAGQAVGDMPLDVLDELWDAGLLESAGSGRYQIHQTIADYERVRGIDESTARRLVQFVEQYLHTPDQNDDLLELEMPTILTALEKAEEMKMHHALVDAIDHLVPFWQRRARYLLVDRYVKKAYDATVSLEDASAQMRMLHYLADFAEKRGDYEQAEQYGEQGLALARQLEQPGGQSVLLTTLGMVAFNRGEFAQAARLYEQGLKLARQAGDEKSICILLGLLASLMNIQGHLQQAAELANEGLVLARRRDDGENISTLLTCLARVMMSQGRYAQAEEALLEALELVNRLGYQGVQGRLLGNLAQVANNRGEYEQAEAYFLQGVEMARQSGSGTGICVSLMSLASFLGSRRNDADAERYALEGLEASRRLGNRTFVPSLLAILGEIASYRGDEARANAYLEEAVSIARQGQGKLAWQLNKALCVWGNIALHSGHLEEAAARFQEVLAQRTDPQIMSQAFYGLAQVTARQGDISQARQLGQRSLTMLEKLHSSQATEVRQWMQTVGADACVD